MFTSFAMWFLYIRMKDDGEGDGLAYDSKSSSVIKLNNGMVLYLREVNKYDEFCMNSCW